MATDNELREIAVLYEIRKLVEPVPGKLMQDELVEAIRRIIAERDDYREKSIKLLCEVQDVEARAMGAEGTLAKIATMLDAPDAPPATLPDVLRAVQQQWEAEWKSIGEAEAARDAANRQLGEQHLELTRAADTIAAMQGEVKRMRCVCEAALNALQRIAEQHTTSEMDEDFRDDADFECGYDTIIRQAREALKGTP